MIHVIAVVSLFLLLCTGMGILVAVVTCTPPGALERCMRRRTYHRDLARHRTQEGATA